MDDWFTIVLAFIFFVLPLLEGVLKKSKRNQQGQRTPPPARHPELPVPPRAESGLPTGAGSAEVDSSWSDGWGSWPGEELEEEEEPEAIPSWSAPEVPERLGAESRTPEVARVPVEVAARVPDDGILPEIGRSVESQRLQDLAARLDTVAKADSAPIPSLAPAPAPAPAAPRLEAIRPKRARRHAALLGGRNSVRSAIIVSEILGSPLAVREQSRD